ncbi:MAG: hypothetical protein A3J48_01715 [Candidatus Doudnabacteria bacterium RIFCSPHIGHO2_02_FULL_46_11]|uniref:Thymidylate synthase n=1 Tax=Candidatus Doudnabacteria bacterium RIFCSPHIGHO2_02_FULL_46_11 TaxID=1817832 RepID=A0A1F5P9S9_9BACT|nr:MAG: hypothetical protein A3J48_01715 [Candidatus Doudnabacteria bacterium RIFCSPHIGHO2_02_FULL_46_11]
MFTDEEKKLLENYVTSAEDDIFAVKGMEGMTGAAYARYSRAKGGFREVLLKEFIKEGTIDPKHADQLIERILVAYGDDSVGELEGAHISFENITMLAAKEIEDRRIGGSPIEQSTRYVFYDQKTEAGHYRYLRDDCLVKASFGREYVATMDFIFETYASLVEPMKEYFEKLKPMAEAEYDINGDGQKEKYSDLKEEKDQKAFRVTYNIDLRTKACDTLRAILPVGTLTNVGMFGNGRFYQGLISYLLSTDNPELQKIAEKTMAAASQIIPQYVRRARRSEYSAENRRNMFALAEKLFGQAELPAPKGKLEVHLLEPVDRDVSTLAAMLYPFASLSMKQIREKVEGMTEADRQEIIMAYVGERKTRRDRPGRALEDGYPYNFDTLVNFGVYKDLQRHRMNTQVRQLFTTKLGFIMPDELVAAGFEDKIKMCVEKSDALFDKITTENQELAQYAVLHGNLVHWFLGMNDREAMHMIELRTTPQGHPQYRYACQLMHKAISEKYPWRAEMMKFADYNDYYWSRADSEARQRVKERKLDEKYGEQNAGKD